MVVVQSWGRLSADEHTVAPLADRDQVEKVIARSTPGIPYGMGRSYGDVCLNPHGTLWMTRGLDHFISFNEESGRLICESGVLLRDIQRLFIPRGWTLAVTPGTQMITVGGAIANDVHGKNHHAVGTFGNHILKINLQRTDGSAIECGPQLNPLWFAATVGGLGLTGVIITAEIQLKPVRGPWLSTETIPYANLDEFFHLADTSEEHWEHTVSWIDCISGGGGRGIFMRANSADSTNRPAPKNHPITFPIVPPVSVVNQITLRSFNALYYTLNKRKKGLSIAHYENFFYPLDNLLEWNRMYGPRGFYQYQSVVPREGGNEAIQAMLKEIARSGNGSFLAVLKTFGQRNAVGMLSFPKPGVTLALDFPNRGASTHKLFERLDHIVRESGGRLYPAKDARMSRELFEAGYPRLSEFQHYRDSGIRSALSYRLMGA